MHCRRPCNTSYSKSSNLNSISASNKSSNSYKKSRSSNSNGSCNRCSSNSEKSNDNGSLIEAVQYLEIIEEVSTAEYE